MEQTSEESSTQRRDDLEEEYRELVEPEVSGFIYWVAGAAVLGGLSLMTVETAWADAVERLRLSGASPALCEELAGSSLPGVVWEAAQGARDRLAAQYSGGIFDVPRETLEAEVRRVLGLESDDLEGLGKILTPNGGEISWDKVGPATSRTVATADFNQSMLEEARRDGWTHKRWVSREDSRVRPSHVQANFSTIPIEDDFHVGMSSLRYPGDLTCSDLSEIYNCRCVLVLLRMGDRPWDFAPGDEPWNNPRPWGV